jgi:hypothetical protein
LCLRAAAASFAGVLGRVLDPQDAGDLRGVVMFWRVGERRGGRGVALRRGVLRAARRATRRASLLPASLSTHVRLLPRVLLVVSRVDDHRLADWVVVMYGERGGRGEGRARVGVESLDVDAASGA